MGGVAFAYPAEIDASVRRYRGGEPPPHGGEEADVIEDLVVRPQWAGRLTQVLAEPSHMPPPKVFHAPMVWLALVICLGAAVFAAVHYFRRDFRHAIPASYVLHPNELEVLDVSGNSLWRVALKNLDVVKYARSLPDDELFATRYGLFFDSNGERRLLFVYFSTTSEESLLYCFDSRGHTLWIRSFGRAVTTGGGNTLQSVYQTWQMAVLRHPRGDGGRIVIVNHHQHSWPANLTILTETGKPVAEYWHPGWIYRLILSDVDKDGKEEILLGGVNDGYIGTAFGPSFVVLDPDRVFGQSASAPGDAIHQIQGVPPAQEAAVLLFPDFDRTHPDPYVFLRVAQLKKSGDSVHLWVSAQNPEAPAVYYELDRRLRIQSITPDPHTFLLVAPHQTGVGALEIAHCVLANVLIVRNRFFRDLAAGAAVSIN